jgi:hypothetical protein
VTPGDDPAAAGAFASQADQPGLIDMDHFEFSEDLLYLEIDILSRIVLDHDFSRRGLA